MNKSTLKVLITHSSKCQFIFGCFFFPHVVITQETCNLISGIPSIDDTPIGDTTCGSKLDHFAIVCALILEKLTDNS